MFMKNITIFFLVLLSFSIVSCNKSNGKHLVYGMNQTFQLMDGEQEVTATKERVRVYEFLCAPGDISLPINKVIEANNYGIYISFADTSLTTTQYIHLLTSDSTRVLVSKHQATIANTSATSLLMRVNDIYVTQYWKSSKVPGMNEVFSLITKDSALAKSVFDSSEFLQSRLEK